MKFLRILPKFWSGIFFWGLIFICVSFSVTNYSKNYMSTLEKSKHIKKINNAYIKVVSYPEYENDRVRFEARIVTSSHKEIKGCKFSLYYFSDMLPDVNPGDIYTVSGDISFPSEKRNIGGFDSLNYGKSESNYGNIYATKFRLHKKSGFSVINVLYSLREKFTENADLHFSLRNSGVVKALVTGDKTSIYTSDKEALQKSGVYHIVAISGLHLNIFIMVFAKFIASLKIKRLKKAILSCFICTFVGVFVLIFTGFGLSVLRAFIMLVVFLGSSVFSRKYNSKNSLLLSAVIIIISIPSSLYNVGFELSVLSTLGVLISADIIKKLAASEKFKNIASLSVTAVFTTSVVCSFITLPVTINSFGYVSLYSPLANFIILPLMAPALGGCVIFGILSVGGFIASAKLMSLPVGIIIRIITISSQIVSALPMSTLNLYPAYTIGAVICILTAVVCIFLLYKKKRISSLITALILCVALAGNFLYNNNRTDAKVVFADVGQGECTILVLPQNEAVMFDFGTNSDISYIENDIRSTLIKLNVPKLSAAFVSHFHKDHVSGLINLVQGGLIEKVYIPEYFDKENEESMFYYRQLLAACEYSGAKIIKVVDGYEVKLNTAEFSFLAPDGRITKDANEMSAVVKMAYGNLKFLFTGDISRKAVKNLSAKDIDCDVLKVPHHGSKNSADAVFIKNASPRYAVISCSENNSYGHPHIITLDLLKENGTEVYRTDKMGAVIFSINKERIKSIETMR